MAKWAVITKDHDFVTKRTKAGAISAMLHFKPSAEPVPVTEAQWVSLLEAEAAIEGAAPSDKKVVLGKVVDKASATGTGAPA